MSTTFFLESLSDGALIHSIIEGRHLSRTWNVFIPADGDDKTELHSSESTEEGEYNVTGLESLIACGVASTGMGERRDGGVDATLAVELQLVE